MIETIGLSYLSGLAICAVAFLMWGIATFPGPQNTARGAFAVVLWPLTGPFLLVWGIIQLWKTANFHLLFKSKKREGFIR